MQNGEGTEETAGTKNQTSSHHSRAQLQSDSYKRLADDGVGGWWVVMLVVAARLVFDVSSGQ